MPCSVNYHQIVMISYDEGEVPVISQNPQNRTRCLQNGPAATQVCMQGSHDTARPTMMRRNLARSCSLPKLAMSQRLLPEDEA